MSKEKTIQVNCMGENCPVPLVETRKAIRKATIGDVIEVIGDHKASLKEIPMAVKSLGLDLLGIEEKGNIWKIRIKVTKK